MLRHGPEMGAQMGGDCSGEMRPCDFPADCGTSGGRHQDIWNQITSVSGYKSSRPAADVILITLQTDLMCGKNAGCATAIVLSGITNEADNTALPEDMQPDYVLQSVVELVGAG